MIDTHNGKIRIRRWPRSRGKTRSPAQKASEEQFRAWQWASKYISPTMYADIVEARKGTPILPRDFITAMLAGSLISIVMPDGKVLWPMAGKNKISETLDALGQTQGYILMRGKDYWEATPLVLPSHHNVGARAYRDASHSTTNSGWQIIPLDAEDFDTGDVFDQATGRFVPPVEGYWFVNVRARINSTAAIVIGIAKNGTLSHVVGGDNGQAYAQAGSALIHCNGSTDYLQLMLYCAATRTVTTGPVDTWMEVRGPVL